MGNPKDITGELVRQKAKKEKSAKRAAKKAPEAKRPQDLFRIFTYSLVIICFVVQGILIFWMDIF